MDGSALMAPFAGTKRGCLVAPQASASGEFQLPVKSSRCEPVGVIVVHVVTTTWTKQSRSTCRNGGGQGNQGDIAACVGNQLEHGVEIRSGSRTALGGKFFSASPVAVF
jgi:hypothetical protein